MVEEEDKHEEVVLEVEAHLHSEVVLEALLEVEAVVAEVEAHLHTKIETVHVMKVVTISQKNLKNQIITTVEVL